MERFGPATGDWFNSAFAEPTRVQNEGWNAIASGQHALLVAPTGSGKTLAAFLWCIDQITRATEPVEGTRVLYVSPLKALVYDVERNLRTPLIGIDRSSRVLGVPIVKPTVAVRTGDTTPKERRQQLKNPADILVTTPESLYLLLGSQARENLRSVDTVIIDEVHALAPTKRGAHLALSLERLTAITERDPQRIGLSATARPLQAVAGFLGGDRPVTIVDTSEPPRIDLEIIVPVEDMTRPEDSAPAADDRETWGDGTSALDVDDDGGVDLFEADDDGESLLFEPGGPSGPQGTEERGMWPAIYPRLLQLIREHHTSIIFVNSRGLCERLCQRLNDHAGEELVLAHHGSVSHAERRHIEEQLKNGEIAGIVATSSLELGIDMGAVDLVMLIESPHSTARGLQRIGRAGHGVGEMSKGRLFPKHRGDLLEAAVVADRMARGDLEAIAPPRNPLDVLAQQVVAMVSVDTWDVDALGRVVGRAANFRELPKEALIGVLDMLAGRYPSHAFADLRPRIVWDREKDELTPRRGAKMLSLVNGGTIPDRGTYAVHLGDDSGPRVGELDEEMVHETVPGQVVTLGATTWKVERITRDRVVVSPAPGEAGKLPFWRGEGPGRPLELGRAMGAMVRGLGDKLDTSRASAKQYLQGSLKLDALAAENLLAYIEEQREATGTLPTDKAITIEHFRDELGDWRVCILTPFGARVHAPWALALEAKLSAATGFEIQTMWSDDGIVLRFVDTDELPAPGSLVPTADEVEDLLLDQLGGSALFAGQFRENAARSLLLPRRRPNQRTPLWVQRLKSQELLAVARQFPSFPVIMETYRSCLQDVFDVPALIELLRAIESREVRIESAETSSPSPFARSLVFAYVSTYLYEGDSPLAERKAQALSLDRRLLRELLGEEQLRDLLDADVIADLERELQCLTDERRARHADAVHDLVRRLGDLSDEEIGQRCEGDPGDMLQTLERTRRVVTMRIGGEPRRVAVEDVALYRDALGAAPPVGVPAAFLEPTERALETIILRYARTRGPFVTRALAERYGLVVAQLEPVLRHLDATEELLHGEFRPDGSGAEWCHPDVLRRIKRRTLAALHNEVAPVEPDAMGRFLPAWHGIDRPVPGQARLMEVIAQLEGMPLSYAELESTILPARVKNFKPLMLDELGAMGWLVWVGNGALGARDGKVALYRRDRVSSLVEPPEPPDNLDDVQRTLLDRLTQRGAQFFAGLTQACPAARSEDVLEALWDLVWAGLVTNDTFGPLRAIGPVTGKSARQRSRAVLRAAGGRWSLVSDLLAESQGPDGPATATERAHARAIKLLERHGVVAREVADLEPVTGGFSATYQVLRAMEEAGKVRRGYFVEGLGGAQFAFPGAVDRLRGVREPPQLEDLGGRAIDEPGEQDPLDEHVTLLSAVDPANPFGWLLPWPVRGDDVQTPRRVPGAVVVLVAGAPVLYLSASGKSLTTFPAADDGNRLVAAARQLRAVAARKRGKTLFLETIDGRSVAESGREEELLRASFRPNYKGLELDVRR